MDAVVNVGVAITIFNLDYGAGGGSFDELIPTGCNEGGLTTSIYGTIITVAVRMTLAFSF